VHSGFVNRLCLALVLTASMGALGLLNGPATAEDRPGVTLLTVHYPPFNLERPFEGLHGFDHEVASEAFARRGLTANVQYVPWKRAVADTQSGVVPVLLSCARTPEREQVYLFSDPISHDRYGLITRLDHDVKNIDSLDDLEGMTVGTVAGYISETQLKAAGATPMDIPSELIGLRMVLANRIDYIYAGIDTLAFEAKQAGLDGQFGYVELRRYSYSACFSRAHEDAEVLRDAFNAGLAELRADGTYDAIHARYR